MIGHHAGGLSLIKPIIIALITVACLVLAVYLVGVEDIIGTLATVNPAALLVAALCILVSHLLAAVRFALILKVFDGLPGWRALLFAFSVGQVSNHFLFNILGQSVSRAMALKRAGVPVGVSVLATYVERLLAAGLLFIFALGGLWYLLRHISFDLQRGGGYLLFLGLSALIVAVTVLWSLMGRRLPAVIGSGFAWLLRLWSPAVLTILIHVLTLAAYVVVLESMRPGAVSLGVIAALVVVMFTASLPISFSGWGVRELSAATALGLVNVSPGMAVSAAVAIGVLSFAVMTGFAVISLLLGRGRRLGASPEIPPAAAYGFQWDVSLARGCALFCAIFVFFQLRIPLAHGALTVNVADLGAATGLGLFVYLAGARKIGYPLPRFVTIALGIVTALLVAGLLSALLQGNLGNWALINRGVGWFVILGYVATGALGVALLGDRFREQVLKAVIVAGLAICAIQLAMLAYSHVFTRIPHDIFPQPIEGFVNNQNALAFQLTIVAVCLLVALRRGLTGKSPVLFTAGFVLLTLAMYYSKSRVGLLMLVILAAVMYGLSSRGYFEDADARRRLRLTPVAIVAALVAAALLPYAIYGFASLRGDPQATSMLTRMTAPNALGIKILHGLSDNERVVIFNQAWRLWLENPILGSGLGSFVEWRLAQGQPAQVIHSIVLWLMVEMGLVGLAVVVGTAGWLAYEAWRRIASPWGLGLLGILVCLGIGGLLHDFFYQRIFWLLLGLFCAIPALGGNGRPRPP